MLTKQELKDFENKVVENFEKKLIRGPIHLSDDNEDTLIEIFKEIKNTDWVLSTWRNHYHGLLHGVNPEWMLEQILAGKSINLNSAKNKYYSSAIVTGILPIAVGIALGIKLKGSSDKVYCFIGDMSYNSGVFYEALKYTENCNLPVIFVIEDNGLSTNTPTQQAWNGNNDTTFPLTYQYNYEFNKIVKLSTKVWYYKYKRNIYPHTGVGKFVHF